MVRPILIERAFLQTLNSRYLMESLAEIRLALIQSAPPQQAASPPPPTSIVDPLPSEIDRTTLALSQLCTQFGLSSFERGVLLLCAGLELLGDWGALCAAANGDPQRNYPTFSLALAILPQSYWQAITPQAPLRRWHLVELGNHQALAHAPLRLDERILHYLMGVQYLDTRLASLLEPLGSTAQLVPSHTAIANRIFQIWQQSDRQVPVIQLCGSNPETKRAIAHHVAQQLKTTVLVLPTEVLATATIPLDLIQCLLEREWRLNRLMVLFDFDYADKLPIGVMRLIDNLRVPLILSTTIRYNQRHHALITFEVDAPSLLEQQDLWQSSLESLGVEANGQVQHLITHFNLTPGQIQSACLNLGGQENPDIKQLWEICRTQSRPRLDELAQRIEVGADWSDLVLPEREQLVLQTITAQVQQRLRVYQDWGFGNKKKRGLGITALFAGASGTGKTMAAEAIAAELNLDVYRIDLSSIISKYIGETEKNLRKLFDAAEGGGVILLFDEADALFGKRSEVKDSHDRHANVEVAYLLQRMEAFQGLAILTTNLKSSLDQAFLRRIRFVINFPFPKALQREEIWRRVFPTQTPTKKLDYELLAKLEVAGGNIKSIAMNAAFIAAEADEPIQMKHLLQATRSEYIKIEKVLTDAEIRDWVD
ncbi:MAG: ATP-binding protein [Spirulina sp. SIO3F2]|nr:ATP-binding protein [Spirulina sp. SIO3F2]